MIHANLLAIDAPGVAGKVYNVACGERVTVNRLVRELRELLGADIEPVYTTRRPGEVEHSLADLSLARRELRRRVGGGQPLCCYHRWGGGDTIAGPRLARVRALVMLQYASYIDFPGWGAAPGYIEALIDREGARSVLEVGVGRSPTLNAKEVLGRGIEYAVSDIDPSEIALVDPAYVTLCFDMSAFLPLEVSNRRFDLIFSRMVNEHIADGAAYYANIFRLLTPGGLTVHFFATLFTVPTLVNRFVPEPVSARLRAYAFARSTHHYNYEKFPARYSWCLGPSAMMFRRFQAIGFEVEDYVGFFGHAYYRRVPVLHKLEQAKVRWLMRHPVSALTSSAVVSLRKPGSVA